MKLNATKTVAVSTDVYWLEMDSCPIGVKVALLGEGGVALFGIYRKGDEGWQGWSPVPARRKVEL